MGWKASALDAARRSGVLRMIGAVYGRRRLTVLAYHRIADAEDPALAGFRGNVSASAVAFARQLDWLGDNFSVVGLPDVLSWLDGDGELPDRPALITFDDGYRDNLETAAPLLADRGMPATLFLTTDPADGGPSLYWDRAAAVFEAGPREARVDLPIVGEREWATGAERRKVIHEFVYSTKWLEPSHRLEVLDRLQAALGTEVPDRLPGLYLDWDEVRRLDGWTIGAHTVSHPVLTSVTPAEAEDEIARSAERIAAETGSEVRALAYPNGLEGDYDRAVVHAARRNGIRLAFSLRPGPARIAEVKAEPMTVRRTYVTFGDGLGRFAGKVMGVARLPGVEG